MIRVSDFIIPGFALLAAGLGFLIGYQRRTRRSLVGLFCTAAALVGAFSLLKWGILPALRPILPGAAARLLEKEVIPLTAESAGGVLLYVLFAGFAGLLAFFPVFGILRLLLLIPDGILRHRLKKKESAEYRSRAVHKAVGGVAGLLAGLLLILPILAVFALPAGLGKAASGFLDDSRIRLPEDGTAAAIVRLLPAKEDSGISSVTFDRLSLPLLDAFSEAEFQKERETVSALGGFVRGQAETVGTVYSAVSGGSSPGTDDILRLLECIGSSASALQQSVLVRHLLADVLENLKNLTDAELPLPQETVGKLAASLRAGDGNFENLLGSVKNAASIAVQLSAGETDSAAIAESISWLSENMNEDTAEAVKAAASSALAGLAEGKTAEVLTNAVSDLCDRLASGEKISEEQSKKNAEALTKFYDIGTKVAGTDLTGKAVFGDILPSASELLDTICGADVISDVVSEIAFDKDGAPIENPLGEQVFLSEPDRQELKNALEAYQNAHPGENQKTLDAIAHLFGL